MKKPDKYNIKKWLNDVFIVGVEVWTESDISGYNSKDYWIIRYKTDWMRSRTKTKEYKKSTVQDLLEIKNYGPTYMSLKDCYADEVNEYEAFVEKNEEEHQEYLRLKSKYEGTVK